MTTRAFTLIEVSVTLVLISLMTLLAIPPLTALRDGNAVAQEARRVLEALDYARGAAVRLGATSHLSLSDSSYVVSAVTLTGDSIVAWRSRGSGSHHISLTGGGAALLFSPSGIAMGVSNRTLTLKKGSAMRKVVISRLGRVTY